MFGARAAASKYGRKMAKEYPRAFEAMAANKVARKIARHPYATAGGIGAAAYAANFLPSSRQQRKNQNSAVTRNMRRAQSTAAQGISPKSSGGFTL